MRDMPQVPFPVKSQVMTIAYKGKLYKIRNAAFMEALKAESMQRASILANDKGIQLTEDALKAAANKLVEETGFSTLQGVLDKMTPAEVEQWKLQYRFGGIIKAKEN